jgi:hypothetical protein
MWSLTIGLPLFQLTMTLFQTLQQNLGEISWVTRSTSVCLTKMIAIFIHRDAELLHRCSDRKAFRQEVVILFHPGNGRHSDLKQEIDVGKDAGTTTHQQTRAATTLW